MKMSLFKPSGLEASLVACMRDRRIRSTKGKFGMEADQNSRAITTAKHWALEHSAVEEAFIYTVVCLPKDLIPEEQQLKQIVKGQ